MKKHLLRNILVIYIFLINLFLFNHLGGELAVMNSYGLLGEAMEIFWQMKWSDYSHDFYVDEKNGIYKLNCSSFLGFLIEKMSPEALEQIPQNSTFLYPQARFFEMYFEREAFDSMYWERVESVYALREGDILAWRFLKAKKGNTGHVVIVLAVGPMEGNRMRLRILDSTNRPHAKDTRKGNETGLGMGDIWIIFDPDGGRPTGYYWSDRQRKAKYAPISMGRLKTPVQLEKATTG